MLNINQKKISEIDYRKLFSVKKTTFLRILEELNRIQDERRKKEPRGQKKKLSMEKILEIYFLNATKTMSYSMLATLYDVADSTIYEMIHWVENALKECGFFF